MSAIPMGAAVTERILTVQGAETAYTDRGSGRTTLFLHGNPDTRHVWSALLDRLDGKMRCLAPDLPGFGGSEVPPGFDFALERQAGWVASFLDAAGVKEPVDLVVHDVGGPYGFSWLVTQPQRVRRLVVFNSNFSRELQWHFWARIWRRPILGELSMASMNWPLFKSELKRGGPRLTDAQIRETYRAITPRAKKGVLAWYRKMDPEVFAGWDTKLLDLLAKIPTLVLWGEHDPYLPLKFADHFTGARVRKFPDCGHWVMAESPDESAKEILSHLG